MGRDVDKGREQRLIARMLALTVSVAQAKRSFPGTPPRLFYEVAPHDGRGRFLTLGQAFQIARVHAEAEAAETKAVRAADDRAAALAERQASAALPALDQLAGQIAAEMAALTTSLLARGASHRARLITEGVAGLNARHAARGRARVARQIEKGGLADGATS